MSGRKSKDGAEVDGRSCWKRRGTYGTLTKCIGLVKNCAYDLSDCAQLALIGRYQYRSNATVSGVVASDI